MNYKPLLAGLTSLSLLGCATHSSAPPATPVRQASLEQPCPEFADRELPDNAALARAYVDALRWGADCRRRHAAAIGAKP